MGKRALVIFLPVICLLLYTNWNNASGLFNSNLEWIQVSLSTTEELVSSVSSEHQQHEVDAQLRGQEEEVEVEVEAEAEAEEEIESDAEAEAEEVAVRQLHDEGHKKREQVAWDSSKCAVIGLAAGYGLEVYEIFVGSLRATGYNGQIILGLAPNAPQNVLDYLALHNVTTHFVEMDKTYCTYRNYSKANGGPSVKQVCGKDYPDYKIQWGRFPLARDWILECGDDCSDGIMLTDVRDAFFQSNPFEYANQKENMIAPIMVFEENFERVNAQHWLNGPVTQCHPEHEWHSYQPMICSGSTMGTRDGILNYLEEMVLEFEYWKDKQQCRFDLPGDDQSIHNYLVYSGKLDKYGINKIPHRTGPIHVCGCEASGIFQKTVQDAKAAGHDQQWVITHSYVQIQQELYNTTNNNNNEDHHANTESSSSWRNWLPSHANTNKNNDNGTTILRIDATTGYLLNLDGMPSPQVHQFDRFSRAFHWHWLKRMNTEVWNPKLKEEEVRQLQDEAQKEKKKVVWDSSKKKVVWDSSKCAVIGLAAGYGLDVYEIFVGSLRATGYNGQIILGLAPNAPQNVLDYLAQKRVTTHFVEMDKSYCTYRNYTQADGHPSVGQVCGKAYPDYKIQWGRFPLARDWILECGDDCSDGIMLTDVRDAFFQSNPFEYANQKENIIAPIMVFEESFPAVRATHWLNGPVRKCHPDHKWHSYQPMICSGSTMGTRDGTLNYLKEMVLEFDYWKDKNQCRFDMPGDDQSIHNYLVYSGKLDKYGINKIPHRTGPIHVCGVEADLLFRKTIQDAFEAGHGDDKFGAESWVINRSYMQIQTELYNQTEPSSWRNWLPSHVNNNSGTTLMIDATTGYLLNSDGMPSPQVHQFDRFSRAFHWHWLKRMKAEVWNPK